eukprot:jgi/Ulvmu1/11114/UM070_0030.1
MTAIIQHVTRAEDRREMLDRQLKKAERVTQAKRASAGSPNATPSKSTRSQSQSADPKIQAMRREHDREHDEISQATKRLCSLFDCTVVTRCRDVQAAVRLDIVVAVGEWTVMYPSLFMKDAYLKYIAWGMSDKDATVRRAAVEAVTHMVQDEDDALALEAFLGHFRARIVETGTDVEPSVCLSAQSLLHLLLQHGLVSLQQLLPVMRWLHVDTATAPKQVADVVLGVVELLVAALQATAKKILEKSRQQAKRKSGGRRASGGRMSGGDDEDEEQMALLTALRDFFRLLAGEVPRVAHMPLDHHVMKLLVQHLQPQLPVLSDWKVLAGCLRADVRDGLEKVHLQDLATLLATSVEVVVASNDPPEAEDAGAGDDGGDGGEPSGGRRRSRRRGSKGDAGGTDARQEVSLVLMDTMPGLLRSFANDPHVVKALVGVLQHLDYGVYVAHSHSAAFEDLVNDVAGLFERSQDSDTLTATAATLAHCAQLPQLRLCEAATQTAGALQAKAAEKLDACALRLSSITDVALKKGVAAMVEGTVPASTADDAGVAYVFALRGAVARVRCLSMQEAWNRELAADERVRASLYDILAARTAGRPLPAEVVTTAGEALTFLLVVDMQRVHRIVSGGGGLQAGMSQVGAQAEVSNVAAAARSFVERCVDLLGVPDAAASDDVGAADVESLKHGACMALMEVLCLCNAHREDDVPELEGLAVDVTDDTADMLWARADALLDSKAECCQEIDSLREDLESGAIADAERSEAMEKLAAAEARDKHLLKRCEGMAASMIRLVLCRAVGTHAVRFAGNLMAHCPLLDERLTSITTQFVLKIKKLIPHMLPQALLHALSAIFEELCQLDESRYGMEDFQEIARALAKPLNEFGTSQALLLSVWNAGLGYVAAAAPERLEFISLGMVHFVPGLNAESAETVLGQLESESIDMTQGLAEAVAGSDVVEPCLRVLREKAAKKPMPSALKKKGAAKGGRKKARFQKGADSDGDSDDDAAGAGKEARPRPKAKVPATKENVNKLISGGGGWVKRRGGESDEEEEDEEDAIEDTQDPLPTRRPPQGKAAPAAAGTPGRTTRTSQRAASEAAASPAPAQSIDLTADHSDDERSGSDAEMAAPPPAAAAAATPRAASAAANDAQPASKQSPAEARPSGRGKANSLMASDTPSHSQLNSLAATPSQAGGVGSLGATLSQSHGGRRGNSLMATDSGQTPGSVARSAGAARRGTGRQHGLEVLPEADEAGGDVEMMDAEDEGVAHGAAGASEGWDSMPQGVKLPAGLFESEEPGADEHDGDVEMQDAASEEEEAEEEEQEPNEEEEGGEEEEEDEGDAEGAESDGGDGEEESDSEPEETMVVRRRRPL